MIGQARVVIIGGGSLGVNLLYHLTREGWTDICLIEKGELTSGSTWHAAGLCSNFIGNMTVAKIHDYTIRLYNEILPKETGEASAFHQTGSLRIGYSKLEEEWFRNLESRAKNVGCEFHFVSKAEAKELQPFMDFDNARVIVSTPDDGHVDPTMVVMPMAQLARDAGATIQRFTRVTAIEQHHNGEWKVITDQGDIIAEHVVNAAGCFAPEVSRMVGAEIPLVNLEHQYLVTENHPELEKLDFELPVCRDSYCCAYLRQEGRGLLVGPYETWGSKPWALNGMNWNFDRELFPGDIERLMPFLDRCIERMPIFGEVGVKTVVNGPITHTPDDNVLAGPQAGLKNFWNLCGSSIGIAQGGIGKYMAQWMVYGQTELNMAPLDSRRFGPWADREYQITKAIESYEIMYAPVGASQHNPHGRPKRNSPLYPFLINNGAKHGIVGGYEKPLWFSCPEVPDESLTWLHSEAHTKVGEECRAVRDAVGIIDISGSAKFEITGKEATTFLDHLSCNRLPAKDGRIGLTLFHGPEGGIMAEQSISRIDTEHYYLIGAIGSELKDRDWMEQHSLGFDVHIHNRTDEYGAMLITGPNARDLLAQLTAADLGNKTMPWLSLSTLMLDSADVRVMRVSYAGELGYELHMPRYQLPSIYESLIRVGGEYGLRDFGGYAFNSLRLEKAYRAYGSEFTEEISGLEAGVDRFIDLSRDFIGADNLRKRQSNGLEIELAMLIFDDDIGCECYGNEAVLIDGKVVGLATSGAYGFRIEKSLAFAYLNAGLKQQDLTVQVQTSAGMREAHIECRVPWDAKNERLIAR